MGQQLRKATKVAFLLFYLYVCVKGAAQTTDTGPVLN